MPVRESGKLLVDAVALLRRWRFFDRDALSGVLWQKTDTWLNKNDF
jgi:hypothetical protein